MQTKTKGVLLHAATDPRPRSEIAIERRIASAESHAKMSPSTKEANLALALARSLRALLHEIKGDGS